MIGFNIDWIEESEPRSICSTVVETSKNSFASTRSELYQWQNNKRPCRHDGHAAMQVAMLAAVRSFCWPNPQTTSPQFRTQPRRAQAIDGCLERVDSHLFIQTQYFHGKEGAPSKQAMLQNLTNVTYKSAMPPAITNSLIAFRRRWCYRTLCRYWSCKKKQLLRTRVTWLHVLSARNRRGCELAESLRANTDELFVGHVHSNHHLANAKCPFRTNIN